MSKPLLLNYQTSQKGFTILEIITVLVVIGILAVISVGQFTDASQKGRDNQRFNAITTMKSLLEEYHQDKGGYPSTISTSTVYRLNPDLLVSPDGSTLQNHPPVESEFEARKSVTTSVDGPQYIYIPYPEDCTTHCNGYILASFIEIPTIDYDNPHIVSGTYNN